MNDYIICICILKQLCTVLDGQTILNEWNVCHLTSIFHCQNNCQVFYIHNLPNSVTQMMLRKRFQAFGDPEDCKVIIKNEYVLVFHITSELNWFEFTCNGLC